MTNPAGAADTTPQPVIAMTPAAVAAAAAAMAKAVDQKLGGGPSDLDTDDTAVDTSVNQEPAQRPARTKRSKQVNPQATQSNAADAAPQENDMSKTKTSKTKGGKKAKATPKAKAAPKGPGVIATIARMMQRKTGASKSEIHAQLVKDFPKRDKNALLTTASIQVNRYPKEHRLKVTKERSDKRGLVYYLAAPKA